MCSAKNVSIKREKSTLFNFDFILILTKMLHFYLDGSSDSEFKKVIKPKTPTKPVKVEPVTTSTPPIRRGRGRPRKYPLPDNAQKTPDKKPSDAPKVVTRKQSVSNSMSRVSKLLSTIRNATDTESDGTHCTISVSATYLSFFFFYINSFVLH